MAFKQKLRLFLLYFSVQKFGNLAEKLGKIKMLLLIPNLK